MTKIGAAFLAASFLTSQRVAEVASDYLTWIAAQATEATAIDALLAASRSSKNPSKVLALAATYYDDFDDGTADNVAHPVFTSLNPAGGDVAGGTVVTITGNALTGTTGVTFGGVAGTALDVVSDTEVTVTSPPHAAATVDVVLTTPAGTATKAASFTYA